MSGRVLGTTARFAADKAATTFPGGSPANVTDPNIYAETAGELVARGQDPNFARVDAQMNRVAGVLQHMRDASRGKSIAAAHTEAMHLAQALGSAHANNTPGQREHIMARAEQLRGLVRNLDEYMLPAQQQGAGQANADLADRLLRRNLLGAHTTHYHYGSSTALS